MLVAAFRLRGTLEALRLREALDLGELRSLGCQPNEAAEAAEVARWASEGREPRDEVVFHFGAQGAYLTLACRAGTFDRLVGVVERVHGWGELRPLAPRPAHPRGGRSRPAALDTFGSNGAVEE